MLLQYYCLPCVVVLLPTPLLSALALCSLTRELRTLSHPDLLHSSMTRVRKERKREWKNFTFLASTSIILPIFRLPLFSSFVCFSFLLFFFFLYLCSPSVPLPNSPHVAFAQSARDAGSPFMVTQSTTSPGPKVRRGEERGGSMRSSDGSGGKYKGWKGKTEPRCSSSNPGPGSLVPLPSSFPFHPRSLFPLLLSLIFVLLLVLVLVLSVSMLHPLIRKAVEVWDLTLSVLSRFPLVFLFLSARPHRALKPCSLHSGHHLENRTILATRSEIKTKRGGRKTDTTEEGWEEKDGSPLVFLFLSAPTHWARKPCSPASGLLSANKTIPDSRYEARGAADRLRGGWWLDLRPSFDKQESPRYQT